MSSKIKEITSNFGITEKKEKQFAIQIVYTNQGTFTYHSVQMGIISPLKNHIPSLSSSPILTKLYPLHCTTFLAICLITSAKVQRVRGAPHHPALMGNCTTTSHNVNSGKSEAISLETQNMVTI